MISGGRSPDQDINVVVSPVQIKVDSGQMRCINELKSYLTTWKLNDNLYRQYPLTPISPHHRPEHLPHREEKHRSPVVDLRSHGRSRPAAAGLPHAQTPSQLEQHDPSRNTSPRVHEADDHPIPPQEGVQIRSGKADVQQDRALRETAFIARSRGRQGALRGTSTTRCWHGCG